LKIFTKPFLKRFQNKLCFCSVGRNIAFPKKQQQVDYFLFFYPYIHIALIAYLNETDLSSLFSEASSADHHLILGNETLSSSANSALFWVFTVVSGVSSPKLVRHFLLDGLILWVKLFFLVMFMWKEKRSLLSLWNPSPLIFRCLLSFAPLNLPFFPFISLSLHPSVLDIKPTKLIQLIWN